jgi:uncharacterized protein
MVDGIDHRLCEMRRGIAMEMTTYRPGVPCWIDLPAPDPSAAAVFYHGLFGWRVDDELPEGDGRRICYLADKPVASISTPALTDQRSWVTYVAVDDAGAAAGTVRAAGGRVLTEPAAVAKAGRAALCADPTAAVFGLWEAGQLAGAELVNEPGTLRRNELTTREPAAAVEFYRTLFGWEVVRETMGSMAYSDWKLAGDTIGGLQPMDEKWPEDEASHWMVYFDVADTDAAVERAVAHGATLIVPPTDVPPGRFAVLDDPQGAVFSLIKMR